MALNRINDLLRSIFKKGAFKRIKKEIFNPDESNAKKAVSIGLGVFMGIFPVWGFQMILAVSLSVLLRLNKVIVLLFTNISLPPLIPFIIYFSYKAGSFYFGKDAVQFLFSDKINMAMIHLNLLQYLVGAGILAILSGFLAGLLGYFFLLVFRKKKRHEI